MTRVLAAVAALVAVASLSISLTRTSPSAGVTSCAQIAHDYVVQVAQADQLHIDYYKLLACHKLDANHAVARAEVTVDQFGLTQSATLVYHMTRQAWQISVTAG